MAILSITESNECNSKQIILSDEKTKNKKTKRPKKTPHTTKDQNKPENPVVFQSSISAARKFMTESDPYKHLHN